MDTRHVVNRSTRAGCVMWIVVGLVVAFVASMAFSALPTFDSQLKQEQLKQEQIETRDKDHEAQQKATRREQRTAFEADALDGLRAVGGIGYWFVLGLAILFFLFGGIKQMDARVRVDNRRRYWSTGNGMVIDADTSRTLDLNTGQVHSNESTHDMLLIHGQRERIRELGDTGQRWNAGMGKTAVGAWTAKAPQQPDRKLPKPEEPQQIELIPEKVYQPQAVSEFMDMSSIDCLMIGKERDGRGIATINANEKYHFIIGGGTNYGKSWMTSLILAQLNRAGVHNVVLDGGKRLVDYQELINGGLLEGQEIDGGNLTDAVNTIATFAKARQDVLTEDGHKTFREYERKTGKKMQRYCFVIEETNVIFLEMQKTKKGLSEYNAALSALASLICWVRQVGIHIVFIAQSTSGAVFQPTVRVNASTIAFNSEGHAYQSLGCTKEVMTLRKGEFVLTSQERNKDGRDVIWQTPWSERDEENLCELFKPQAGKNIFDGFSVRNAENAELSGYLDPKRSIKQGYREITSYDNPILVQDNPNNPQITHNNPTELSDNSLNNPFDSFDWASVDWLELGEMSSGERNSWMKANLPKVLGEPDKEWLEWEINYLRHMHEELDGNKTALCFALFGAKGGNGDYNRSEWLQDAIDDYLEIEQ